MRLVAVVLLVVVLAGCASNAGGPPAATPAQVPASLLPGEDWVLMSMPDEAGAGRFGVTLRFEPGRFSGRAPVNEYFGELQIGDGVVTFGPAAATKMAGPPDAMRAETVYLQTLSGIQRWEVVDEILTLSDDAGPLLAFAAPGSTGAFAVTLIGDKVAQARAGAQAQGYGFRVLSVDGRSRAGTADYRPDRINAAVEEGRVTEVTVG